MHVFATGSTTGPLRRAAQAFVLQEDATFEVTVGSALKLIPRMCEWQEGDLFCGGSESTLDSAAMYGCVLLDTLRPLGAREAVILVPNGNPADIKVLRDLTRRDVRIGVSDQGSLVGLWEEVALRAGLFHAMRPRVNTVAAGSSDLMGVLARREVDAAIGWASAAMLAPEKIEWVVIEPKYLTWRTTSIGVTSWCERKELARTFITFLCHEEGQKIYHKFGWKSLTAAALDSD